MTKVYFFLFPQVRWPQTLMVSVPLSNLFCGSRTPTHGQRLPKWIDSGSDPRRFSTRVHRLFLLLIRFELPPVSSGGKGGRGKERKNEMKDKERKRRKKEEGKQNPGSIVKLRLEFLLLSLDFSCFSLPLSLLLIGGREEEREGERQRKKTRKKENKRALSDTAKTQAEEKF